MGFILTIQFITINQLILKAEGNCIVHISYRIYLSILVFSALAPAVCPFASTFSWQHQYLCTRKVGFLFWELHNGACWRQQHRCKLSPCKEHSAHTHSA